MPGGMWANAYKPAEEVKLFHLFLPLNHSIIFKLNKYVNFSTNSKISCRFSTNWWQGFSSDGPPWRYYKPKEATSFLYKEELFCFQSVRCLTLFLVNCKLQTHSFHSRLNSTPTWIPVGMNSKDEKWNVKVPAVSQHCETVMCNPGASQRWFYCM